MERQTHTQNTRTYTRTHTERARASESDKHTSERAEAQHRQYNAGDAGKRYCRVVCRSFLTATSVPSGDHAGTFCEMGVKHPSPSRSIVSIPGESGRAFSPVGMSATQTLATPAAAPSVWLLTNATRLPSGETDGIESATPRGRAPGAKSGRSYPPADTPAAAARVSTM